MNIEGKVSIHNKHDIFIRSAETGELLQRGYAENIIVDRMYTRLCAYNTYFNNIVYGSGTTPPVANKSTLGTRINYKAATQVSLVRALPTSVWVKSIRLGSQDENGQYIREIGISNDSTQINTHALIVDSEGQPLEIYKTSDKIVDIYSTVYITLYDVDSGLFWWGTGLRDYLTGANMASDQMGVGMNSSQEGTGGLTVINSTRTNNPTEKWVKSTGLFTVEKYNKDIRCIQSVNTGLVCILPRLGDYGFADYQRTDVPIGKGDGETKVFALPNKNIKELSVKVDGVVVGGWDSDLWTSIVFDTAPGNNLPITGSFKCNYIPKDDEHELEAIFKIQYAANEPTPVMPDPVLPDNIPGGNVIAGTTDYGYCGVVPAENLISGDELCSQIGLTAGASQYSDAGWLKYSVGGKPLFVAKKTIRHTVSWDSINAVGAVFGGAVIWSNGILYKVRLLSTEEWDKLMYPIHKDHPDSAPNWENFEDCDLHVDSSCGNGSYSWTSTPSGSDRVRRGYGGVTSSGNYTPSSAYNGSGFRPVLEIL